MPERRLTADMFRVVGVEIVIQQRPAPVVRFGLRRLRAERGHAGRHPVAGNGQQQALRGAVVRHPNLIKRGEIHLSGRNMRRGQPRAQQVGAGNKESAFTLRHRHDQTGIVVVDHEGELEDRFIIYRLCLRRWRQTVVAGLGQGRGTDAKQYHHRWLQFTGVDCHCASLALICALIRSG